LRATTRTQEGNRREAHERLTDLIPPRAHCPKARKATKPTRAAPRAPARAQDAAAAHQAPARQTRLGRLTRALAARPHATRFDMYASAAMAFLHHLAAFTVVAAAGGWKSPCFKPPLSLAQARRLLRTDFIFGASATVVLVVGMLRVAFFEKGREYYWHDLLLSHQVQCVHRRGTDLDLSRP